jgi:hypothetical protein
MATILLTKFFLNEFQNLLVSNNFLCVFSCNSDVSIPESHAKRETRKVLNYNEFPTCNDTFLDTTLLLLNSKQKGGNNYFEHNQVCFSNQEVVKLKIGKAKEDKVYILMIQNENFLDTIFEYKITNDSLFVLEKEYNEWDFKIVMNKSKEYDNHKILFLITSYFHSLNINKKIRVIKIVDILHSTISHYPKNKDIKISEIYLNDAKKILAFKYKCKYYYVSSSD